jgi:sugar/nucleoside kinase (ribokinase family)
VSGGDRPLGIVGNLNVDLWIRSLDRFPDWDEELIVDSARLELAGTAGYLLQASRGLGLDVVTVSTVGDDPFGQVVLDGVRNLGCSVSGIEVLPGQDTSLGMIFVGEDGRRGILTTLGAHAEMDLAVAQRHDDEIAGCREVVLCGNYLLPKLSPGQVLDYARTIRGRGQQVVFDPGWDPASWGERTRDETFALLAEVDVYMPNEEELRRLTGTRDWRGALRAVEGLTGEVVLKRGAGGAVHARAGTWCEVPAFPIAAVNTIGAGDVFDVGYLHGVRQSWEPRRRLQFASALAASVISQPGARVYPSAAATVTFLQTQVSGAEW